MVSAVSAAVFVVIVVAVAGVVAAVAVVVLASAAVVVDIMSLRHNYQDDRCVYGLSPLPVAHVGDAQLFQSGPDLIAVLPPSVRQTIINN